LRAVQETEFILRAEDCVAAMRQMPKESVDLVVTSPPYNLGIKYGKYEDERHWGEYWRWSLAWVGQVRRVLKRQGSFFLNVGACPSNPLLPYEMVVCLKRLFVLQNTFHWVKSITVETKQGDQISAGHFKPIQSPRFVNDCHEFVFHLTKTGKTPIDRLGLGVPYSDKSNIARWGHTGGRDLRCRGNNWFIPYKTILSRSRDRPHPATFPVQLAVNCIRIHGGGSDLVMLDPFVGIGHSAQAAKECGLRKFIGFDIDAEYVEVARGALANGLTRPTPELVEQIQTSRPKRRRKAAEDTFFDRGLLA
jgi:site-specific DNA-methyltransferase (adenine-specific)